MIDPQMCYMKDQRLDTVKTKCMLDCYVEMGYTKLYDEKCESCWFICP